VLRSRFPSLSGERSRCVYRARPAVPHDLFLIAFAEAKGASPNDRGAGARKFFSTLNANERDAPPAIDNSSLIGLDSRNFLQSCFVRGTSPSAPRRHQFHLTSKTLGAEP
jgi:hypothetical protein